MKPETKFRVNQGRPFLKTLRHTCIFPIQQLAIVGDPDFILCCRGLFVGLELKDKGEKPTKLQAHKGSEVHRCDGIYLVASPDNWPEVRLKLQSLDGGIK